VREIPPSPSWLAFLGNGRRDNPPSSHASELITGHPGFSSHWHDSIAHIVAGSTFLLPFDLKGFTLYFIVILFFLLKKKKNTLCFVIYV